MNKETTMSGAAASSLRPWHILGLAAVLIAAAASFLSTSEPLPEKLVRVETERALPSMSALLKDESPELNLLFLNYASDRQLWMSAALALLNHGDAAREILLEYGMVPEFQAMLIRFGSNSMLPIRYFREHDIRTLRAQNWVNTRFDQLKSLFSDAEAGPVNVLTPYRRGLFAIALLSEHGHGMLDQFAVDDKGDVIWLQGERIVSVIGEFFTGGLRDLESQWRRGEGVGAGDLGWASLDLLVIAGSVKVLRAGKAAGMSRAGQIAGPGRVGGGARFASLAPMAKVSVVLGAGYAALRHPGLVSAAGASVANWLGWPEWLGQFVVWFLVLLPFLFILRFFVFWILWPCLRWSAPLARSCATAISGRPAVARTGAA